MLDALEPHSPVNVEIEQELLGAIMANNSAFDRVSAFLRPEHFSEALHGRIFETASAMISTGRTCSPITLKTYFERDETIADIGGVAYLARLAAAATTIINAEEWGRQILDLAQRRNLIDIGTEIVNGAMDARADEPAMTLIERAEQALYGAAEQTRHGVGVQPFGVALTAAISMASAAYQRDGGLSGIATGLIDLDEKMGGLQASDLIIIAGRPAMGKTSLATNIAFHAAKTYRENLGEGETQSGAAVLFFSLEMSMEQLATRIASEQAQISSSRIRRGQISEHEFHRLAEVSRQIHTLPLYIDATGGLAIGQLAARARKAKRQRGIGLIVVDYIQLLSASGRANGQGRVQEITEITMGLKAIAKELNVPVIALSQLSRQVENREDKRPQLSDLRESGSIEQDADVVIFLYRDEYYLANKEPRPNTQEHQSWDDDRRRVAGKAEAIIGKQRHGPTGIVQIGFDAELTRFYNLAFEAKLPERFS